MVAVAEGIAVAAAAVESIAGLEGENNAVDVADTTEGTLFAAGREVDGLVEAPQCGRAPKGQDKTAEVTAALNTAGHVEDTGRGAVELGMDTAETLHCCCP